MPDRSGIFELRPKANQKELDQMRSQVGNGWLTYPKPNPRALARLFCFPYAGGNAAIYRSWPDKLSAAVEVCAVQIPGRGSRIREQPYTDLNLLLEALVPALLPSLDKPFLLFGHSMGATIAFELARLLKARNGLDPLLLIVSARAGPGLAKDTKSYDLPDSEFVEYLRDLNGTPSEVLAHPDLMQLMMPILRADFQLIQTYQYPGGPPLECPITAFGGLQDEDTTKEDLREWQEHTTGPFKLRMVQGDHFFLHAESREFFDVLAREVYQAVSR